MLYSDNELRGPEAQNLPNDHRHTFKLYGAYDISKEVEVGINFSAQSGAPISEFGVLPAGTIVDSSLGSAENKLFVDGYNSYYGGMIPYINGAYSSRGSQGTLPWIVSLDLLTRYSPRAVPGLRFGVDIYNILNGSRYQAVQGSKEFNYGPNIFYGAPRSASYQQPRALRLSLSYELN